MRCVLHFVDFWEEVQGDHDHQGMELRQMHLPAQLPCPDMRYVQRESQRW
jgi:hypothetical protein